jgi:hypothetical protein
LSLSHSILSRPGEVEPWETLSTAKIINAKLRLPVAVSIGGGHDVGHCSIQAQGCCGSQRCPRFWLRGPRVSLLMPVVHIIHLPSNGTCAINLLPFASPALTCLSWRGLRSNSLCRTIGRARRPCHYHHNLEENFALLVFCKHGQDASTLASADSTYN